MKMIEIYGQSGCSFCTKAENFVNAFQLPSVYRDIGNPADKAEMFRRNPSAKTVPQIFIGDKLIGGHDQLVTIPVATLQQMIGE